MCTYWLAHAHTSTHAQLCLQCTLAHTHTQRHTHTCAPTRACTRAHAHPRIIWWYADVHIHGWLSSCWPSPLQRLGYAEAISAGGNLWWPWCDTPKRKNGPVSAISPIGKNKHPLRSLHFAGPETLSYRWCLQHWAAPRKGCGSAELWSTDSKIGCSSVLMKRPTSTLLCWNIPHGCECGLVLNHWQSILDATIHVDHFIMLDWKLWAYPEIKMHISTQIRPQLARALRNYRGYKVEGQPPNVRLPPNLCSTIAQPLTQADSNPLLVAGFIGRLGECKKLPTSGLPIASSMF